MPERVHAGVPAFEAVRVYLRCVLPARVIVEAEDAGVSGRVLRENQGEKVEVMKSTEEIANGNLVTNLGGSWPQWFGNLGKWFIYVRIRHGQFCIGTGRSKKEAVDASEVVREDSSLCGVTGIDDAIAQLRTSGYIVKSKIVSEHVEELP